MKLGIGIDTGGTFTDAVVYDLDSGDILGTAKALTTRQDLSEGILRAIDDLPPELTRRAEMIALSTTLATNACVEDKGGRAKLIFFGGDAKTIDELGGSYGLPPSSDIYLQESYMGFSGRATREPDWALFQSRLPEFANMDGVGIIEMYAMRDGAVTEKKAKEIFQQAYSIPVVCGHELFCEMNSLQRAASTLLNARLIPVIREFLDAVKKALAIRGIRAPLVVVRSDGSVMSEQFASVRPVETLLCGPAASAMGSVRLAGQQDSIVVDMGGTTTDLMIVRQGTPVSVTDGVAIGKWKTFVNGLYVKTFGLGADSAIHYEQDRLYLEEYRVTPLCVAAASYPQIVENLQALTLRKHTRFLYEHYMLVKDIGESSRYTAEEKAFCRALADGPLPITEAARAVGKDIYTLDIKRLLREGVVQLCGLTPTDIMHLKGDFTRYCKQASELAAAFAAYNLNLSVHELGERVYDEVKRKLYVNLVSALLENGYAQYGRTGVDAQIRDLIEKSYDAKENDVVRALFHTDFSLVGIGAPIHVFLEDVARKLNTRAVIPKHHEVANALGAVMGGVVGTCTVEIRPDNSAQGTEGYTVFGSEGASFFEEKQQAIAFASAQAEENARREAVARGAIGEIAVTVSAQDEMGEARECNIYLGTWVTARAAGNAGF